MNRPPFPSSEEGLDLHHRLLAGDPVAPKDFCERYLEPLYSYLLARFRRADEHTSSSAVTNVVMAYLQRPAMFDAEKLDLGAFLRMAAQRKLSNLLRDEFRHLRRRESNVRVEHANSSGNYFEDDPASLLMRREEQVSARRRVDVIRAECNESEREVLDLMLDGERSTQSFAIAIGAEDLSEEDKRRGVKRVKDRVKKRIERGGGSDGESIG